MSTNYYFINKESRKEAEEHNKKVDAIFEEAAKRLDVLQHDADDRALESVKWKYEVDESRIHIGKRSMGWIPLFEACEHFESVKEMKRWYFDNKDEYIIENEYNEELTWNELVEELIDWDGKRSRFDGDSRYIEYYADEDRYEWTRSEFS